MTTYPLRLNYAIDESTSKAREELLRLGVAVGLAVRSDVLLVRLLGLKARRIAHQQSALG